MAHINYPASEKLRLSVRAMDVRRRETVLRLKSLSEEDLRNCKMYHINQKHRAVFGIHKIHLKNSSVSIDRQVDVDQGRPVHFSSESQEPTARRSEHAHMEHKSTNRNVSLIQQALSSILIKR